MWTLKISDGDFELRNGRFEKIEGVERVSQNVMELLWTERLENGFGTGLIDFDGSREDLNMRIREAVRWYINVQKKWSVLGEGEVVTGIKELNVDREGSNMVFELVLSVNSESKVVRISGRV